MNCRSDGAAGTIGENLEWENVPNSKSSLLTVRIPRFIIAFCGTAKVSRRENSAQGTRVPAGPDGSGRTQYVRNIVAGRYGPQPIGRGPRTAHPVLNIRSLAKAKTYLYSLCRLLHLRYRTGRRGNHADLASAVRA